MKTIIIATDFSESATNAAQYAAYLSGPLRVDTILLYHSYDAAPKATEIPLPESKDAALAHEHSLTALEATESQMEPFLSKQTAIEIVANDLPVVVGIQRLLDERKAGLVVTGITGKSNLEKFLMGSNTIAIADACTAPVLVVPEEVEFKPIAKAVFACDLEKVDHTMPIETLSQLVDNLAFKLLVLNIEKPETRFNPDVIPEQYKLHGLLDRFHPEYHYIEHGDVVEGIMDFAETQQADLVMTVPKRYGFFDNLFHKSVTKKLAHHSRLPLLIFKTE
ncbi:universal stress protein [Parapedobacter koreensis]|uniref:Nucleotide-binding universal stress protein, UspA family n=1 Tax=Parapedobacter koreensis TaxID=332977 RepID=A0A1H7RBS2_9SPHI|nr:universal stress protein [Parapedobacter koreensis]SEL57671.1 Nucleotide-binding universal stress protein, UspA family [Parapedobacter koreensis]